MKKTKAAPIAMYPTKKVKKVSISRSVYPFVAGFTVPADTDCVTISASVAMVIAKTVVLVAFDLL